LALLVAIRELGLHPIAVLVDNGFIPQEVQDNAASFCSRWGAAFRVERIDISEAAKRALSGDAKSIPCRSCITQVFSTMGRVCREFGLQLIIGGHRFPPLAYTVTGFTGRQEDDSLICVSPLLARRLTESEQLQILEEAGWEHVDIAGNTSNCKLIGVVEAAYYDANGFNPHLFEVSKEIRAGIYSREYGFEKVSRPKISDEHRNWVFERLNHNQNKTHQSSTILTDSSKNILEGV
jgi:hypothetical protein